MIGRLKCWLGFHRELKCDCHDRSSYGYYCDRCGSKVDRKHGCKIPLPNLPTARVIPTTEEALEMYVTRAIGPRKPSPSGNPFVVPRK